MTDRQDVQEKAVKELTKFVKRALDATEKAWAVAHRVNEDHAQQEELFREMAEKTSAALTSLRKAGLVLGQYVIEKLGEEEKE